MTFKQNSIIHLHEVKKIYEMGDYQVHALDGVDIDILKGEFVSIVGKSGSGKSTMVNLIGCLDIPTEGAVYLDKKNIAHMKESDLAETRGRKIGFIFQTFNLMPTLNVRENVAMPLIFQDLPIAEIDRRVNEAIELVELTKQVEHKPGELSGGQRQRVAIARALVNYPEVVLADEPTGNLDSVTGSNIMKFLIDLNKKKNVTLILVTHDRDLARAADRTLVLADGKIVEEIKNHQSYKKKKKYV